MSKSLSIILAASLAVCVSCTKQEMQMGVQGSGNNLSAGGDMDYITAVGPGTPVKTIVDNDTKVFWESGDKIGMYSDGGATAVYTTSLDQPSAEAVFGRTSDNKPAKIGDMYYAVYPSSAVTKWSPSSEGQTESFCYVNVPKQQTASIGSWDPKSAILVASSQSDQLAFKHAVAYVRFEVTGQTGDFVSVRLVSNNSEKLSDIQAKVKFGTSGEVLVTSEFSPKDYVDLINSETSTFAPGVYYIAFIPGDFSEGLSLYFSDSKGLLACKKAGSLTLKPGEVSDWGQIPALTFAEGKLPGTDQNGPEEPTSGIDPLKPFDLILNSPIRVSLVGDSITTYEGTLVTNFADSENGGAYYPTGTVNSVTQQYWYKLINNKMTNAVLDVNNSLRGSMVMRRTETGYENKDYSARVSLYGLSSPDVVFIHGGTNDCTKHSATYAIRPGMYRADMFLSESFLTESFSKGFVNNPAYDNEAYKGMAPDALPSDEDFNKVYATAEAADTWDKVVALEDRTFIHAYVKLLNMIHYKHPNAKVVMIIGDALTKRAQQAILKIADHYGQKYGYKCVNFFGLSDNISKVSGAHPDDAGFTYMADEIFKQVGTYIDAR